MSSLAQLKDSWKQLQEECQYCHEQYMEEKQLDRAKVTHLADGAATY